MRKAAAVDGKLTCNEFQCQITIHITKESIHPLRFGTENAHFSHTKIAD